MNDRLVARDVVRPRYRWEHPAMAEMRNNARHRLDNQPVGSWGVSTVRMRHKVLMPWEIRWTSTVWHVDVVGDHLDVCLLWSVFGRTRWWTERRALRWGEKRAD